MTRKSFTLAIGAVVVLMLSPALFMFQVRQTEVAVVTTFGRATRPITEPGLKLKWPPPIQRVHKFDQRIQNYESAFEQVLTPDGYNFLIMVYAGWNISDPAVFFPRFGGSMAEAQKSLEALIRNAYSAVVGNHPFSHFISADPKELKFDEIEAEMFNRVKEDARSRNFGIDIKFFGIKKLGLPESVTELVFERMRSERQVVENKIKFEGEREASVIRSAANLESARLLTDAEAQAKKVIGEGEREAAKHLEVFKQEPDLAAFLLQLDGLQSLLKERATLVLDLETFPLNALKGNPAVAPSKAGVALPSPAPSGTNAPLTSKNP